MFKGIGIAGLVLILIGLSIVGGAFYVVDETEQVIITQFGKPVGSPITTPGLHIKIPFIQDANYFDKRFLAWDGEPSQVPTKDKRFIWVDTYARWRIKDPLLFFQRLRDERGAQSRLDDILDGETRNVIAKHLLIELVQGADRRIPIEEVEIGFNNNAKAVKDGKEVSKRPFNTNSFGREELQREILKASQERTKGLGIEVLDFRFKRINYVGEVRREVYARMISERKRIAEQYRSEGAGEAARIAGQKDRELKVIRSEAYKRSKEIKGKADEEAARIYAEAYNKAPEFYAFLRTLETYKNAFKTNSTLILSTENDFLKYLKNALTGGMKK